jgi:hypothetical protein
MQVEQAPAAERCDGVDNDGDTEVDEDWPELGEGCGEGEGRGECVEGRWVCAAGGQGLVCEGAVGPVAEICDGKDNDCDGTADNGPAEVCDGEDNDCDGLVDEGVLEVKREVFDDRATVAAIDGGFAVTRVVGERIRVETYGLDGSPTGGSDAIDTPVAEIAFVDSDSTSERVVVALGKQSFHVVDIHVDSGLIPVVLESSGLHEDWRQGIDWGVYAPPIHPRVLASPSRFLGYRDLATFALNPFSDSLAGLADEPTVAAELPILNRFDAAGSFVVWEQSDNVRAGWLLDDGSLLVDIDVALGRAPAIAMRSGGPGVAFLQNGELRISELGGATLACVDGGYCNEGLGIDGLEGSDHPTALAYDEGNDLWFVAAGANLVVVARASDGPVAAQRITLEALRDLPARVEVAVSGGTAAVVHAERNGETGLSFLGCF